MSSDGSAFDVIRQLPLLGLDDLPPVAYEETPFSFAHDHAEKAFPYVDDAAHEWTGRQPLELTVKLHFNNTLIPDSFPGSWDLWWIALQSGEPKELTHPVLGTWNVVVKGGDVQINSRYRGGVVATVRFRSTLLDPTEDAQTEPLSVTLDEAAAQADAACSNVGVEFPTGYVAKSLRELLAAVKSFKLIFEAETLGVLAQVKGIATTMDDILMQRPDLDHVRVEAHDALVRLWTLCDQIQERTGLKQRPTSPFVLPGDTTLTAFAEETGNTLAEIMGLNPGAIGAPLVPGGTMLKAYQ